MKDEGTQSVRSSKVIRGSRVLYGSGVNPRRQETLLCTLASRGLRLSVLPQASMHLSRLTSLQRRSISMASSTCLSARTVFISADVRSRSHRRTGIVADLDPGASGSAHGREAATMFSS